MTVYFYFTLSVIFWDLYWFQLVPNFEPEQRAALFIFLTFTILVDAVSVYEYVKIKRK